MPWRQVNAMTERLRVVRDARQRLVSFTELSAIYGIRRCTGYKWLNRAHASGRGVLQELSHRSHACPPCNAAPAARAAARGATASSQLGTT